VGCEGCEADKSYLVFIFVRLSLFRFLCPNKGVCCPVTFYVIRNVTGCTCAFRVFALLTITFMKLKSLDSGYLLKTNT
jgi:hypothetical protein